MPRWIRALAAALFLRAAVMPAQEFRRSIAGRVLDSRSAVVPYVKSAPTQVEMDASFGTREK